MQELIGRTLGQYRIVEIIGQGGMATVFKGRQPGLERWVAVKVLPPQYAADSHFSAHFLREAQAIAQLEHPHILPVYDFGQQGQYIYLVMRYIEGSRTLADVMRQPISFSQALNYLDQVSAALDYAHEHGIVHRDVKPGNILLSQGWIFLADFGLARLTEARALAITDVALGTPAYMSPEQGRGARVDSRTDVYALGAIVFEMVSGEIPHRAESGQAILYKRNHESPPSLRENRPEVPRLVDQIIRTALAVDPAERFESAGAFVRALRRAIESTQAGQLQTMPAQPLPAVPYPLNPGPLSPSEVVIEPSSPVTSPNKSFWLWWIVAGGMALVIMILTATGVIWLFSRPIRPNPSTEAPPTRPGPTLTLPATLPSEAPTPTSVPVEAPTSTSVPVPTDTPAPPTVPAQDCNYNVGGPFEALWPTYRPLLGCPTGEARTLSTIAEEAFEGGHAFWIEDMDRVFIVHDRQKDGTELTEGQWQLIPANWKWDGSNPDGVGLSPPPGLVEPTRGFGWLWRTHLGGADGPLGWALDREYGFDNVGQAQRFEQGLMFKGSTPKVYVLLNNGQFYAR